MARTGRQPLQAFERDFGARQAARMRLPAWLRVLMPLMGISCLLGLTAASVALLWSLHRAVHPQISLRTVSSPAMLLMAVASITAAAPTAFILLNALLRAVPPVRRALDENSRGVPGASYKASMRQLGRAALLLVPLALLLGLIGALEPWAR